MTRAALTLLAILAACDRGTPAPAPVGAPAQVPTAAPVAAASPAPCALPVVPLHRTAPGRIVAIGDLHGDLAATRGALRAAGAIDAADHWIGGTLTIVQTGDALDRGDGEREIIDLLAALEREAATAGGQVIQLLGNHELMNAAGDYRYVTPGGFADFAATPGIDTSHVPADVAEAARARVAALAPGGIYATRLAAHAVVTIVGDTVYSHAGVLADWATKLDDVNQATRCWLAGQAGTEPAVALTADDSPVWTRAFGMPEVDCAQVRKALAAIGAARMVVGHTVQPSGINSACDGTLWRIDVGMTKMFGGPIQVLELPATGAPHVLSGVR